MKNWRQNNYSWISALTSIVRTAEDPLRTAVAEQLDDRCARVAIVAQIRWVMLAALMLYAFIAAASYSFSNTGFVFSGGQTSLLALSVISIVFYNVILSKACENLRRFPYLIHLQIALDLFFVTLLIHFTGGVVSWFWPVYLLVTLESSFLFENKLDVWLIGTLGASLYGALLILENLRIMLPVAMPFIDQTLHDVVLFQVLMWLWVAGMNATVAIIAAFLMDTIRRDRRRVKEGEEALLSFINSANDLIFSCDSSGRILYANQVFLGALQIGAESGSSGSIYDFVDFKCRDMVAHLFKSISVSEPVNNVEITFVSSSAQIIEVEMGLTVNHRTGDTPVVWGVCRDITERKKAQIELYKLAHHDILTGLPNRVLLEDRLQQAKALAHRMNNCFALLFLDLDRFKIINDTLGHSVGDELLRLVAGRIKHTLRETDTVARIGGDEFIALLVNVGGVQAVSLLSDKILKSLALPFHLQDHELFVTTSIGICVYPHDGQELEEMMKKADIAMYQAKALGRNNFQFYDEQMDQNATRRFVISNSLRRGLDQNEFRLFYQPKVDVVSGRIIAMEALVRWDHPELGLLSPMEFISLAEENGLIMQLGEWVLREACTQNVRWHGEGIDNMRVAVNLSGYQLQHRSLLDVVRRVLDETGLAPDHLEFEITESVIMQNPDFAVSVLTEITDIGIHISIDDFGTGYSSLAHLKRFSVNTLKIDKSFVKDVDLSSTDAAIATAIIAMGNSLNLNVIAEGVETRAQYEFLKDNHCGQVQGYLFSRPLPAEEIIKIIRQNVRELAG